MYMLLSCIVLTYHIRVLQTELNNNKKRLSYAGKHLDDSQRTLQQYGIKYWNSKFPDWPLVIRRF